MCDGPGRSHPRPGPAVRVTTAVGPRRRRHRPGSSRTRPSLHNPVVSGPPVKLYASVGDPAVGVVRQGRPAPGRVLLAVHVLESIAVGFPIRTVFDRCPPSAASPIPITSRPVGGGYGAETARHATSSLSDRRLSCREFHEHDRRQCGRAPHQPDRPHRGADRDPLRGDGARGRDRRRSPLPLWAQGYLPFLLAGAGSSARSACCS